MTTLIYSVLPVPPRPITLISPESTVQQCVNTMTELNIGALLVLDEQKRVIGLVSERDVLRECVYKGRDPNTTIAAEIAHTHAAILTPRDMIETAMKVITETRQRHVLIQEKDQIIAILSIGDLIYHLLEEKTRVIEHLEHYITS